MSGFVYKVQVDGRVLIKKEIPGPDTINEFIYEINALHTLQYSSSVIDFFGVVVDDQDEHVKGLLISYAERGTLVDVIYDHQLGNDKGLLPLPWTARATWAKQVVEGLADIHESGFVQGDFTLSNIVIDSAGNAKIIDINRRGCPVGWEPPELRPMIKSSQGISMYIGVKSDLYQLGMVLWALAMEEDEPEKYGPGLVLDAHAGVPPWYRRLVEICLSDDPRMRIQASSLVSLFPPGLHAIDIALHMEPPSREYGGRQPHPYSPEGFQMNGKPRVRTVSPSDRFSYNEFTTPLDSHAATFKSPHPYPTRGRSPPSPLPSNSGHYDMHGAYFSSSWTFSGKKASYSDAGMEDGREAMAVGKTAQKENPVPEAHESKGNQSPEDSAQGAGVDGQHRVEQGVPSHPVTSDKADETPGLPKEKEAVVAQNDTQVTNTADWDTAILSGKSTGVDQGAAPRPTENVGAQVQWSFADGLGIVSDTGITEPDDSTASESRHAPSISPVGVKMPGDRADPRGPTEPETARPNTDSARAPAKSSTYYDRGGSKTRAIGGDNVGEAPQPSPAYDDGMARIGICEKPRSGRTSDGAISVLTGIGGVDEDDLAQFPASLEEEPGLMVLSAKMATIMSAHRGSGETISSPISVGY
ncbi:protein kinase family protein [Candidatus Bathyarchaeota archaeon]|nr:protein kinase family protein [Candidatus Bathyarchaeota archaeon]